MTQEQEKPKETPVEFPRIPKEFVDKLIETVWSSEDSEKIRERDNIKAEIEREEVILWVAIQSVGEAYEDFQSVTAGAVAVYKLFKEFETTGFIFPRVSEEIVLTFMNEIESAKDSLEEINAYGLLQSGVELTNPFLSPYHYAEENPALMVLLAKLPDHLQLGGMLTYELKRRQFHADQLAKLFGG